MRARKGDLNAVNVLPDLMARHDDALVWNGCIQLIGFAGRQQLVFDTARRFFDPHDRAVQWYISEMMLNACGLRAVEPLLMLHRAASERDARLHIQHCLSTLLEDSGGAIYDGPEEFRCSTRRTLKSSKSTSPSWMRMDMLLLCEPRRLRSAENFS